MKSILKTLMIIAFYELSKEITYGIICRKQANDTVEQPKDFHEDSWLYQY